MIMESPVRICIGAALVVHLLLIVTTTVSASTSPPEATSTTIKNDRNPKFARVSGTNWSARNKSKLPDLSINELNPKDSTSEEHSEKNAKYKDRGRVKFNMQSKSTTESTLRRVSLSTKAAGVIIVTPTPEVKKPAQIIESMRAYKKTKIPSLTVVSTTEQDESDASDEDVTEDEDYDDKEPLKQSSLTKIKENSFFTIPSFDIEEEFKSNSNRNRDKKNNQDFSTPSFGGLSSFFPKSVYSSKEEPYKPDTYFDFDLDLTTPKNDFFDKKYHEVASSILDNLDAIKTKTSPNETKTEKIDKKSFGFEKPSNESPNNKSSVYIKNTKEIRYLDNDKAGSSKGLQDVQGTSIYYEMTVLSTETYNITDDQDEDEDCDNDNQADPTTNSNKKVETVSVRVTSPTVDHSTKSSFSDSEPSPVSMSPIMVNFYPSSTARSSINSFGPISLSTYNTKFVTESSGMPFSTQGRNRNYSKKLNLFGNKESSNSVFPTLQSGNNFQSSTNQGYRPQTRRFHFTTPKTKPIWMAPKRNTTRNSIPRVPTTIYYEHFDIKEKTNSPREPNRILTTQPSDIDPVLQSDVSDSKKVVHSHAISDNTIPSLWKRGSTKYLSPTVATAENNTGTGEMEIPPTLTAWALASMRIPPSLASPVVNVTGSPQKNIDENELQKVGEVTDKKESSTSSTTTATTIYLNNDFETKNITEIYQNKLPLKSVSSTISDTDGTETEAKETGSDSNSERFPAESVISLQSSKEILTTEEMIAGTDYTTISEEIKTKNGLEPLINESDQVTPSETKESSKVETIPPPDTTRATGFESITKLPAGITTPKDETIATEGDVDQHPSDSGVVVTDFEITTIRFSYVPTEPTTEQSTQADISDQHVVFPTRTMPSTAKETSITTYRPKFFTTTEDVETSTVIIETTPQLEVSSQVVENVTRRDTTISTTTEITEESETTSKKPGFVTTEMILETTERTTEPEKENVTEIITETPKDEMPVETTTIVVTVVTEINSERTPVTDTNPTTELSSDCEASLTTELLSDSETTSEENSDSNEVIAPQHKKTSIKPETTTTSTSTTTTTTTTTAAPTTSTTTRLTHQEEHIVETTTEDLDLMTKSVNDLEDLTSYAGDVTTESSSRVLSEESGSGAAIAIAVSTIGVVALILLVGLLLVVRRRGRRGVYAQRCTPVSLDAYSLDSVSVGYRKGNQRLRASKRSYGNPAYDDEVTSHPMHYAALANFALDIDSITAEFSEIPSVTVRPEEVPPGCEDKNRYSNVLPLPETRVPLKRIDNDPTTEYINANYITGPGNIHRYYIACQAPLANTVADFWRMIWEQNSRLIVMLTEYMENGVEKSYEYLPPSEISDNKRTFGDFQIILKKREQRDKYAISSIQLINMVSRTWREVTHLWYFWPAKGVPDDYDSVIDFLSEMRSYMKISQTAKEYDEDGVEVIYEDESRSSYQNLSKLREENGSSNGVNVYSPARAEQLQRRQTTNGTLGRMKTASEVEGVRPCACVCASGAGRSCALIAAEVCSRALAGGRVDVPRTVRALRQQRPHALANRHHYVFLYRLLSEYGNKLMGGGVDTI
ncbi:mucin-2 [Danaus plexippus]|uniref:mucin-2 n=1 Tax=Danaus plexippus TaxID=13037 RepID=UPI002AB1DCD6|nr:mucin-2 [Danaus plexippus]XP_061379398.1 mucin-2 [Danaus plexippus]